MLRSTRRLTVLNSHLRSQPATVPRVRTLMMGGNQSIPSKEECLPGRANEMRITNKHFVKGTPIKEPFAEGLKSVTFGNGCFWGSEQRFWEMPGVSATAVGYCGGERWCWRCWRCWCCWSWWSCCFCSSCCWCCSCSC